MDRFTVENTLLKTKLYRPDLRSEFVPRPRLVKRLDEGLDRKLTLVSAPAGYGKTTLLNAWAAAGACPVAWLSLDGGDDDPTRFLTYLAAAVETIQPHSTGEFAALLQFPGPTKIEDLLPFLINKLDEIPFPYAVVLDDYHLITSPEIHRALAFLIDHQPRLMHLFIATRADPPLPIPQMRARAQLSELRQADLRFTDEEAARFLRQQVDASIAADDVAVLAKRTEGWITGLQLASLSMREADDLPAFIANFGASQAYIVDYFAEEILARQTEAVKSFLLKTSILEQLCGTLCDTITGEANGLHSLQSLHLSNLFLFPLDNERHWYRYHSLFAGMLRKKLETDMPDSIPGLHARASRWYEEHELLEPAFAHAAAAGDQQTMARFAETYLDTLWAKGEIRTMQYWIDSLAAEEIDLRPKLRIAKVMLLANSGKITEASSLIESLEQVTRRAEKERDDPGYLHALACVAGAWVASLQQDSQTALDYATQALQVLPKRNDPQDTPWLTYLYMACSNAYAQVDMHDAAMQYLSEAYELGRASRNHYLVLTISAKKAAALWAQGKIRQAAEACQNGLHYAEQRHLGQLPVIDSLLITWGFILCERGELIPAAQMIARGLDLSQQAGHVYVEAWGYQEMVRLLISKGDFATAERYVEQARSLAERHEIPAKFVDATTGLKVIILILEGRLVEAERELQFCGVSAMGQISHPKVFLYLCLARLLVAQGNYPDAQQVLDRLFPVCKPGEQTAFLITAHKIQALLYAACADLPRAMASVEDALKLAEPEGYSQTFLDEGLPMVHLLGKYVRWNGRSAFARKLLAASKQHAADVKTRGRAGEMIESLSQREVDVLALLAEGLSNQAIASRLFLSVRTIKFHASNIYRKLGVESRSEAIVRARRLGLLS